MEQVVEISITYNSSGQRAIRVNVEDPLVLAEVVF